MYTGRSTVCVLDFSGLEVEGFLDPRSVHRYGWRDKADRSADDTGISGNKPRLSFSYVRKLRLSVKVDHRFIVKSLSGNGTRGVLKHTLENFRLRHSVQKKS